MDDTGHDVLAGVGPRLRDLRRRRGATLDQLAAETALTASTLSRLETGKLRPTLEQLLPPGYLVFWYVVWVWSRRFAKQTVYQNHDWAFGAPDALVWALMIFDSIIVGLIATLVGTAIHHGALPLRGKRSTSPEASSMAS